MADDNDAVELYIKHRPDDFKVVVGQDEAVAALAGMLNTGMPFGLLFSGPSGCGKTTLAKILAAKMGCKGLDWQDVNAAEVRGIDMIRDLRRTLWSLPMAGSKCRIWLLDEAHKLTNDAQNALLKILEEPPKRSHLFLCTTDPGKLITTLRTRCTHVQLRPLPEAAIVGHLEYLIEREKINVSRDCLERIAECSDGSARQAAQILQKIAAVPGKKAQLDAIERETASQETRVLCQALLKGAKWPEVRKILSELGDTDDERIRRSVLGYMKAVVMNGAGGKTLERAALVLDVFRDNWYDCGTAGLVSSCLRVCAEG